jgi:hypothetical protein
MFAPGCEWMIADVQQTVDRQWNVLLEKCGALPARA